MPFDDDPGYPDEGCKGVSLPLSARLSQGVLQSRGQGSKARQNILMECHARLYLFRIILLPPCN
jgi:hypothetical protein